MVIIYALICTIKPEKILTAKNNNNKKTTFIFIPC